MSWNTREIEPGSLWIEDGDRLVGSIVLKDDRWHVEIMWPPEDIKDNFSDYLQALAYVGGVEDALAAFKKTIDDAKQVGVL